MVVLLRKVNITHILLNPSTEQSGKSHKPRRHFILLNLYVNYMPWRQESYFTAREEAPLNVALTITPVKPPGFL
jgi:hypothetical protein